MDPMRPYSLIEFGSSVEDKFRIRRGRRAEFTVGSKNRSVRAQDGIGRKHNVRKETSGIVPLLFPLLMLTTVTVLTFYSIYAHQTHMHTFKNEVE